MAYAFSITSEQILGATVLGFRGTEAVSRPFSFQIGIRVDGELPDPASLVHEPLTLEIRTPQGSDQRISGIVARATIVHADPHGGLVRLELVPTLWRAGLSRHNRVFTDVTVPQIIEAVLREEQIADVDVRLVSTYPVREHVGQYKESNLAFISRLMEREGIFYFFDHEGDRERLVIADDASAFGVSRTLAVPYKPAVEGGAASDEAFFKLSMKRAALPRSVHITDWNYRTPAVRIDAERGVARTMPGSIVRHGDHASSPEESLRYARLRAEQLGAAEVTFRATGPVAGLVSGGRFTVQDHPRDALNRELTAIEVEHVGVQIDPADEISWRVLPLPRDITYRATVTAVRSDVPYRAPAVTKWPRIQGLVDGVVDGPATSPYAQIDEHGRYKVRLAFDEGDPIDGSGSTWVRMVQPHGGGTEGFHFPLRKQTEVHVAFAYGDPDRPMIVGVAHNPETPSVVTAANNTQNVIQTGGGNRLEMEDQAGAQRVDLSCPTLSSYLHLGTGAYQFEANTGGEGWVYTGGDLEITVDGAKTEDVLANVLETYSSSQTMTVHGAVTEVLVTNRTTTITGPEINTWTGPLTETVTLPVQETYVTGLDTTVTSATTVTYNVGETLTVNGGSIEIFSANQKTDVTGTLDHTVTGDAIELFNASSSRTVNGDFTLQCDGTYTIVTNLLDGDVAAWDTMDDSVKNFIENYVLDIVSGSKSITGLSMLAVSSRRRLHGLDVGLTGPHLAFTGLSNGLFGVRIEAKPLQKDEVAGRLELAGVNVMVKGLFMVN